MYKKVMIMTKYIQRVDGSPKQCMWNNYSYTYSWTYSRWQMSQCENNLLKYDDNMDYQWHVCL